MDNLLEDAEVAEEYLKLSQEFTVAKILLILIEKSKLREIDFCIENNIKLITLCDYISGRKSPSLQFMVELCETYGYKFISSIVDIEE